MAGKTLSAQAEREVREVVRQVLGDQGAAHNPIRRRHVVRDSYNIIGKTDSSIAKNASGTVSIYSGTAGSETDTAESVTAFNKFANVGSGKWVMCTLIGSVWYLSAAEC